MARRDVQVRMLLSLGIMALCVADSALAAESIRTSLEEWALRLVPAMLPFLAAVPALTCQEACDLLAVPLAPVMRFIGCPGEWGAAYISGLLSGSPGGAVAAARSAAQRMDDRGAFLRLSIAASGASPAFLGGVAGAYLGGASGWALFAAQGLGAIMTARLMRPLQGEHVNAVQAAQSDRESVLMSAARTLVMIGLYMALFSLPTAWVRRLFGERAAGICMMLLELSGGCRAAAGIECASALKGMVMAAVCCFGGASVCAQCLSVLRPLGVGTAEYIYWKMVHAALSALFTLPLLLLLRSAAWPSPGVRGCVAVLCVTVILLFLALMAARKRRCSASNAGENERKVSPNAELWIADRQ